MADIRGGHFQSNQDPVLPALGPPPPPSRPIHFPNQKTTNWLLSSCFCSCSCFCLVYGTLTEVATRFQVPVLFQVPGSRFQVPVLPLPVQPSSCPANFQPAQPGRTGTGDPEDQCTCSPVFPLPFPCSPVLPLPFPCSPVLPLPFPCSPVFPLLSPAVQCSHYFPLQSSVPITLPLQSSVPTTLPQQAQCSSTSSGESDITSPSE